MGHHLSLLAKKAYRDFTSYRDDRSTIPIRISGRSLNGVVISQTASVRSTPSWKSVHGAGTSSSLPFPWFQTETTVRRFWL